jgi:hypothetical protein
MQLEILSDHRLKEQAVQALLPAYDSNDPESINEILKTTNFRESLLAAHGIGETGYLTLDGQLPLYIMSPQLTSFGSTLGPLGQMTIVKKVNAQSLGFGHAIIDLTQHEQDHFVVGGSHLKTLSFKLVNSRGHVVNLNGAWMSFPCSSRSTTKKVCTPRKGMDTDDPSPPPSPHLWSESLRSAPLARSLTSRALSPGRSRFKPRAARRPSPRAVGPSRPCKSQHAPPTPGSKCSLLG